jgi:hypothetical protein
VYSVKYESTTAYDYKRRNTVIWFNIKRKWYNKSLILDNLCTNYLDRVLLFVYVGNASMFFSRLDKLNYIIRYFEGTRALKSINLFFFSQIKDDDRNTFNLHENKFIARH